VKPVVPIAPDAPVTPVAPVLPVAPVEPNGPVLERKKRDVIPVAQVALGAFVILYSTGYPLVLSSKTYPEYPTLGAPTPVPGDMIAF
jgi:hypothetical protein